MRQTVFGLYGDNNKYVTDRMYRQFIINKRIYTDNGILTKDALLEMCSLTQSDFFYVVRSDFELRFKNFDFSFTPEEWDSSYIHMWNSESNVRLFHKKHVLDNVDAYTDETLLNGNASLKNLDGKIYQYPTFDMVYLSYDEPYADEKFQKLQKQYPGMYRVQKVKGIYEAHLSAAKIAARNESDMFYVIDADAELMPDFEFNYSPHSLDRESVHVWNSINPVNGLIYGYGGVKLFPTNLLLKYKGSPIDFTTSVSKGFKVMDEVSNVTRFNVDPFSTWRSAFRECTKLSSKIIPNQDNTETEKRLEIWCTVGADKEYGSYAIAGALAGKEFGAANRDKPDMLGLINNFQWLETIFNS